MGSYIYALLGVLERSRDDSFEFGASWNEESDSRLFLVSVILIFVLLFFMFCLIGETDFSEWASEYILIYLFFVEFGVLLMDC